jgi:predicted nucleic acid-binding protein
MVLVDTSVWINHLRVSNPELASLLDEGTVLTHPFVSGELACGNLKNRTSILSNLVDLPLATVATHSEVTLLLEQRKLWGRGLGWVDVHLLASALLSNCRLLTLDQRLAQVASELGLG